LHNHPIRQLLQQEAIEEREWHVKQAEIMRRDVHKKQPFHRDQLAAFGY